MAQTVQHLQICIAGEGVEEEEKTHHHLLPTPPKLLLFVVFLWYI
jgi:hypothetical protein